MILGKLPLVKHPLLRLEKPRQNNPNLLPVGAVDGEDPRPTNRHAQVEEPRLHRESRRIGKETDRKWVFKGFFNFFEVQTAAHRKRRIGPIKLHLRIFLCMSIANAM